MIFYALCSVIDIINDNLLTYLTELIRLANVTQEHYYCAISECMPKITVVFSPVRGTDKHFHHPLRQFIRLTENTSLRFVIKVAVSDI